MQTFKNTGPRVLIATYRTIEDAREKAASLLLTYGAAKIWRAGSGLAVYPADYDLRSRATLVETVTA